MIASEVTAMVAGYFRYKQQCPVVSLETPTNLNFLGERADVLVMSQDRLLYEIEVKISLSDLKQDILKRKHLFFSNNPKYRPVNKFYFAFPQDIQVKAMDICQDFYPYAGLIVVKKFPFNSAALDFGVTVLKKPQMLNPNKLTIKQMLYLIKEQSGTVCRLARDKAVLEQEKRKSSE